MALLGAVTYCCDPEPDKLFTPSDKFISDQKALGIQAVRVRLTCDGQNRFPAQTFLRGLQACRAIGPVSVVLDIDFSRPWLEGNPKRVFYPNAPLGVDPRCNKRQNPWIRDTCAKAYRILKPISHLIDSVFISNEPNLMAEIEPGQNCPPAHGDKAPAMSEKVFFPYAFEMAGWLRAAGIKTVVLGSLSLLPQSGLDRRNPYLAEYISKGMAALRATGSSTLPVDAIAANMEGLWTEEHAAKAREMLEAALAEGIDVPLWIGEWGVKVSQLENQPDPVGAARETLSALEKIADRVYFFSYNLWIPNDLGGYGCRNWIVSSGQFYPFGAPTLWYSVLKSIYASL